MVTKEEYLRMIHEAYASENEDDLEDYIDCPAWIPAEPEIKKKMLLNPPAAHIDATNLKREAIEKIVKTAKQITVGKFLIHIRSSIEEKGKTTSNIVIYEQIYKTATGLPCNMQVKMDIIKDDRFHGRPWTPKFSGFQGVFGKNITEENMVDIVKWLQAITKLKAFL